MCRVIEINNVWLDLTWLDLTWLVLLHLLWQITSFQVGYVGCVFWHPLVPVSSTPSHTPHSLCVSSVLATCAFAKLLVWVLELRLRNMFILSVWPASLWGFFLRFFFFLGGGCLLVFCVEKSWPGVKNQVSIYLSCFRNAKTLKTSVT